MAYNELIKNFDRVRELMREFFVYGFRSREEIGKMQNSPRTYDDEKRRIESYLSDYMSYHRTAEGKSVFLSIDARTCEHNPLYNAFKAKSFTDGDITLHFLLFDALADGQKMTTEELSEKITDKMCSCDMAMLFDDSTIRKKAEEYVKLGLLIREKEGRKTFYSRAWVWDIADLRDAIDYFSEEGLLGEVGSFLLDKLPEERVKFAFKHKYIAQALDDEILYTLLEGMHEKRAVTFAYRSPKKREEILHLGTPLCIYISAQNGRRYAMVAVNGNIKNLHSYRLDYIKKVTLGRVDEKFDELRAELSVIQKNVWGVNYFPDKKLSHVEFTVNIGEGEEYIFERLNREKRCGTVERIDGQTARFYVDVCDTSELIPWVRSFIGRITRLDFSDRTAENMLKADFAECLARYTQEEPV